MCHDVDYNPPDYNQYGAEFHNGSIIGRQSLKLEDSGAKSLLRTSTICYFSKKKTSAV